MCTRSECRAGIERYYDVCRGTVILLPRRADDYAVGYLECLVILLPLILPILVFDIFPGIISLADIEELGDL